MRIPHRVTPRRGRPPTGKAVPAAERMRRLRARRKAAGLRAVTHWQPTEAVATVFSSHRVHEARSLAMHVLIARKIERAPALRRKATENLARWSAARQDEPPAHWLKEWAALLARPWPEVAARMTALTEDGARLRQSSPFAGVLSPAERRRIHEAFRA